ncbi:helix-turn-helix transcriptional regulator [Deinococcus roseus]|uniref:AraC family transcriptional regulator n=1 Tax=Deinococcus roseus TaxID=392414 RepID=A0ABQ2D1Y9_9DEIO|nr:AraC family transcriptional regulator [Deinococcus roseus]GGJ42375.1 AraC family transcriptional regulator [Deinococcus roseus]
MTGNMDVLSDWVRVLETQSTLLARSSMNPGWGMHVPATQHMVLHLMQGGNFWLSRPGHDPLEILDGEILLLTHSTSHGLTDTQDGETISLEDFMQKSPPDLQKPISTLVCGLFQAEVRLGKHLVQGLPETIHLTKAEIARNPQLQLTLQLLWLEIHELGAGSELLITHLFDTLFLYVLREVMQRSRQPGWLTATRDPQVSRALRSMHATPETPWTVESLASVAGLSRAAFAKRFSDAVGQAPLAYLTDWRMNLAAKMLSRGDTPVYQVATHVGYTSEAAFSRAFKKHYGAPPASFRRGPESRGPVSSAAAAGTD